MAPKRTSTASSGTAPKRARTEWVITRKKPRWSRISGSANADAKYKEKTKGSAAYSYICLCSAPINYALVDDKGDKEDREPGDDENDKRVDCDGGETCICKTPQAERPDHVWTMSNAGHEKLQVTLVQLSLRDADSINMWTRNDQVGYGIMEVIENLVLDFDEAKDTREEQWVICEVAAVLFLRSGLMQLFMIDDSEMVENLCNLIGTMFLTMLAKLEHRDLLKPDAEIKNLALIMALYIQVAQQPIPVDAFHDLDTRVLAYATKHKIAVRDVPGMKRLVDDLQEEADGVELPSFKARRYDPWQWKRSFGDYQDYAEDLPFYALKPNRMGGDGLDITTWSSDRRKQHSLDEKDPLSEDVIDSLKKGLVVQLA